MTARQATHLTGESAASVSSHPLQTRRILGMRVDATTYAGAAERIVAWGASGQSRYVCVATVNNVMEAHDRPRFLRIMNEADLVVTDGMPLVWGLRLLGVSGAAHVRGPVLTPILCRRAADLGVPVGLYGGALGVVDAMAENLVRRYPGLEVAYRWSPPFRPLDAQEDARVVREISASGARILLVGLGSPKQDEWMAAHRDRIPATMVGVGAAFDIVAGVRSEAPTWMQGLGLEWTHRLAQEPGRLWRRYLTQNPRFVALFTDQMIRQALRRHP